MLKDTTKVMVYEGVLTNVQAGFNYNYPFMKIFLHNIKQYNDQRHFHFMIFT